MKFNIFFFFTHYKSLCLNIYIVRRKAQKLTGEEAAALGSVQYVDKARGIAVVLEGEGGDLKGKSL